MYLEKRVLKNSIITSDKQKIYELLDKIPKRTLKSKNVPIIDLETGIEPEEIGYLLYHNSSYCYFRNLGTWRQVNLESIIENLITQVLYYLKNPSTYQISVYKIYNTEKSNCLFFSWLSKPYYRDYVNDKLDITVSKLDKIFRDLQLPISGYKIFGSMDLKKCIAQYI